MASRGKNIWAGGLLWSGLFHTVTVIVSAMKQAGTVHVNTFVAKQTY